MSEVPHDFAANDTKQGASIPTENAGDTKPFSPPPEHISAQDLLDAVLDPNSFLSWDTDLVSVDTSERYQRELAAARAKSGCDESVLTGEGTVRGRRVAVIVCEFQFLAGSVGVAVAERIVAAVEKATALRLPLLASPTSGGTRMQEGVVAFLQMVKIAAAIDIHKKSALPYLVYLRNPTLGGVFASWGSLGHVTVAQPGALVGFLGPRVYEQIYGERFPDGVQTAENLADHGVIDGVVELEHLARLAHRALTVLCRDITPSGTATPNLTTTPVQDRPAWESVVLSRQPGRPGVRDIVSEYATDVVPLSGTGEGERERGLILALAHMGDYPCIFLGQDRQLHSATSPMGPRSLRQARRGMALAQELGIPLVLIVDTWGAALSVDAEERGLAGEIARSLADLVTLQTPTISVLLGQGTGGGALALLPADRVLCAQHAWLGPLPPEGASAIVYKDTSHAADMAEDQNITSNRLLAAGIVDSIIPEYPDASSEPSQFCQRVGTSITAALAQLHVEPPQKRHATRLARYRQLGL